MKHLKLPLYFLLALFVSASFTACSVDNENIEEEAVNGNLDSYLKAINSNNYRPGIKVNIPSSPQNSSEMEGETVEIDGYTVTEVFIGDEERASGYLFESSQTEGRSFVSVNRDRFTVTVVNMVTSEEVVHHEVNELPQYNLTDQFDVIKVIRNPTLPDPITGDPKVVSQGWRYSYGNCKNGVRGVYRAYYFLGIKLTDEERVMEKDNPYQQATVGCDEEYQP